MLPPFLNDHHHLQDRKFSVLFFLEALIDAKHQIIVEGEVFSWRQDHCHLAPVVNGAKENIKEIGKGEDYFKDTTLTADTGVSQ